MARALDSVGFYRTSGGSADTTFQATTIAVGDSFTVRAFNPAAGGEIVRLLHQAEAGSFVRIRSPLLHDNVTGLQFYTGQFPSTGLISPDEAQPVQPQDTLVAEMLVNGTTTSDAGVIVFDYGDLPGAAARLKSFADIAGNIKSIKPQRVQITAAYTLGQWAESAWDTSENNLHANTDYAVLGYITDTACCAIHVKGIGSSNLRIAAPGVLDQKITKDYFIRQSTEFGKPMIPIFNSADIKSLFAGYFDRATHTSLNLTLILAEMAHPVA